MTTSRIVCVTTEHPHRHITSVGIGTNPAAPTRRYTTAQVRAAIDNGDTFYTVSPSTQKVAIVRKDTCGIDKCPVKTIRSHSDAIADNNLDNLSICP